jgi:hypothetical protein
LLASRSGFDTRAERLTFEPTSTYVAKKRIEAARVML